MDINNIASSFQSLLSNGGSTYDLLRIAAHFRRLELEKQLYSHLNGIVADGPFKGMSYLPSAHASTLSPKLTGTYEKEIQDDLLTIANSVNSFLDIGCAEGYYTTGLALMPNISYVVGVDINNESLRAAQILADLNKVSKKCFFTTRIDQAVNRLSGRSLIMIDVDGSEIDVIQNIFACVSEELLRMSYFLIETDYHSSGNSNRNEIINEFQMRGCKVLKEIKQDPSERISTVAQKYTQSFLDLAIYGMEGRPANQSWLIFKAAL